jgi:hypothetical protein
MKKNNFFALLFVLLSFWGHNALAQADPQGEPQETETLFGDLNKVGFMVAPSYSYTTIDEVGVSLFKLRGGLVLGDKITLGGFYEVSMNDFVPKSETMPGIYMDYWAAGGLLEYTLFANKVVHATFPLQIGMGEVQMDNESGDAGLGESNFFVIEPSALLEVNLHKYLRLNAGVGYRFVGDMTYRNLTQSEVSGLQFQVGLKLGLFSSKI